jgi:hypothetical protein
MTKQNSIVGEERSIRRKAIWTFVIFLVAITKGILVSDLHLIRARSLLNWYISYFFIMPIMIIGLVLSVQVIRYFFITTAKRKYQYLLLSLPTILCWVYGIAILILSLASI